MSLKLNSDSQPFVKINSPKYEEAYSFERDFDLTDLFMFTKGQPYEKFAELRERAPIYFHKTGPEDSEPGFWVLTKYKDIEFVSKNQDIFSSHLVNTHHKYHNYVEQLLE